MIPYGRQDITQADIDAVVEVLRSDWLTQGPMVPRFEQAVSEYTGAAHAVAVNSATSALHIACLALDVGPGDRVWTSPNTFVASSNAALYCSAHVDFVDIDPLTYNMSVEKLEKKLEQAKTTNKLPKVVIPVHFAGQPCNMPAFHQLSQEYGFRIIEDASHAIGARYQHIKVGSCTHSDITVFSFHPVKIITTGEGGMALTNDASLAKQMARYRSHGITSEKALMQPRPADEIWNYQQIELGFNYRMTDIQAALGISQIQRLDEFVQRRHAIAHRYNEAFADLQVITPCQQPDTFSSYHLYPIRIRERLCGRTQRQVYDALLKAGIGVNLHYIPAYLQPYYQKLGFETDLCPESEKYYQETISLPLHYSLSNGQQDFVISSLKIQMA
jgi:UDP-4-amino-4,6-dideoxy-N-acetyl-beta-L-altrosamine transaminase